MRSTEEPCGQALHRETDAQQGYLRTQSVLMPGARLPYLAGVSVTENGMRYVPTRLLSRISRVVTEAGFKRFRRATQTPFNIVYEARP